MRPNALRGMTFGPGMALVVLFVSFAPVHGGYAPPPSNSLVGEVFTFVGDFSTWNANRGGLPMEILEATPAADAGEVLVLLFWFWLGDQHTMPGGVASSSAPPGWKSIADLSAPTPSSSSVSTPIGSIVLGQTGNKSPTSLSNGDVSILPTNASSTGNATSSSLSPGGSENQPASASNSGNSVGNNMTSTSPNGGDYVPPAGAGNSAISNGDGSQPVFANGASNVPPISVGGVGSVPPSSFLNGSGDGSANGGWGNSENIPGQNGSTSGSSGNNGQSSSSEPISAASSPSSEPLPLLDPVPEPASCTLLAIGGIGLLVGWRTRSRKP